MRSDQQACSPEVRSGQAEKYVSLKKTLLCILYFAFYVFQAHWDIWDRDIDHPLFCKPEFSSIFNDLYDSFFKNLCFLWNFLGGLLRRHELYPTDTAAVVEVAAATEARPKAEVEDP